MDLQISLGKLAKKHVKARAKRATEWPLKGNKVFCSASICWLHTLYM
jgi:hypothetical protein